MGHSMPNRSHCLFDFDARDFHEIEIWFSPLEIMGGLSYHIAGFEFI